LFIRRWKIDLKAAVSPKKYTLEELLSQVQEPSVEVSWGKPEGEEVW